MKKSQKSSAMCANSIRKKIFLVIPILMKKRTLLCFYGERLEAIIINWPEYDWEYLLLMMEVVMLPGLLLSNYL